MSEPQLVLIAGPNGSGKSTVTARLAEFGISLPANYINADDIARSLADTHPDTPQVERERIAFRQARELRRTYREQKQSFAFETVFSHPSTLLDMLQCRAAGFEVRLLFVSTENAEINVLRGFEADAVTGDLGFPDPRPVGLGKVFLVFQTYDVD